MERKALGKGISALIPKTDSGATGEDRGKRIVFLKLEQVKPNPFQPREDFDAESMEELVQSVREKGIIQPILVRSKGDAFELIAGERRLRAAQLLNLQEIPALVKEVEDRDSLELALIENIQRQELNPIEEARAFQYLLEKFSLTQDEIAGVLGKAPASVSNILRLLKLPSEVQEEIRKGRLSFGHGRALLEIEDANLQRRLTQEIIRNSISVRELEGLLKSKRVKVAGGKQQRKAAGVEPAVQVLEEHLQQVLATRVKIIKKKKRGHILIEFYSQEDLERIAKKLGGA